MSDIEAKKELHELARESIIALFEKTGAPLTERQQLTLAGALAVWIAKAQKDAVQTVLRKIADGGQSVSFARSVKKGSPCVCGGDVCDESCMRQVKAQRSFDR